jgi:hypothetical protein
MSSSINTIWIERNEGLKRIASNTVSFFACSFKAVSGRRGEMRGSLFVGVAQTEALRRRQNKCQTWFEEEFLSIDISSLWKHELKSRVEIYPEYKICSKTSLMIFLERRLSVEFVATTFEILYTARIHIQPMFRMTQKYSIDILQRSCYD